MEPRATPEAQAKGVNFLRNAPIPQSDKTQSLPVINIPEYLISVKVQFFSSPQVGALQIKYPENIACRCKRAKDYSYKHCGIDYTKIQLLIIYEIYRR
jgi:hypothetical protein